MGEQQFSEFIQSIRLDLLELFGSGYVIEHCISAFYKDRELKAYRAYVSDALMTITENTARLVSQGKAMTKRYVEIIDRTLPDTRTEEEVIGHFKAKLRQG